MYCDAFFACAAILIGDDDGVKTRRIYREWIGCFTIFPFVGGKGRGDFNDCGIAIRAHDGRGGQYGQYGRAGRDCDFFVEFTAHFVHQIQAVHPGLVEFVWGEVSAWVGRGPLKTDEIIIRGDGDIQGARKPGAERWRALEGDGAVKKFVDLCGSIVVVATEARVAVIVKTGLCDRDLCGGFSRGPRC